MSNRVLGIVLQEVLPSSRDGAGGISKDELSRSMESMTKDSKMAKKLWLAQKGELDEDDQNSAKKSNN